MNESRICQITPLLPPFKDGVGDSAFKLHTIMLSKGSCSFVITSSDQHKSKGVFCSVDGWTLKSWKQIGGILRAQHISSVLFHYPSPRFYRFVSLSFLPLYFRLLGMQTILLLHEYVLYSLLGKLRIFPMILFSQTIVTCDSINYRSLRKLFFVRRKLHLFPTGSNFSGQHASGSSSQKTKRKRKKRTVLFFGLIRQGKGIESVLELFEKKDKIRNAFELSIIGSVPELSSEYDKQLMDKIKMLSFVQYYGYLSPAQLTEVFRVVDGILLPFEDGLSERRGSFMAAMAFGKPVLTSLPSVPIKGLVDKYNVLYLKDNTILEIEKSLLHFSAIENKMLKQIGANARRWYDSNFSDDILFQKLSTIVGS